MLRAIALSLVLLVSLGVIIPMATNHSEAGPKYHKKKKKKLKKYSKAWWKWYRAKQRRQKTIAARKRALRLRQMQLAKERGVNDSSAEKTETAKSVKSLKANQKPEEPAKTLLPSGETAPKGWKKNQATEGELQFRVDDDSGKTIGTASLGVVGPAVGADNNVGRNKTVGGVQTSALRRTVIDRMMKEQGWVVNDYQKEVGGKRVYVVVAQSPGANGQIQSRTFYFAEVEGRIYSLATNASDNDSERIAQESEKVLNSLQQRASRPVQQAELR
ncbi:MAG: hypothetical protein M3384_20160 [Acidobacteriota bacterium]|nr:hypothetical protein [Acidobacteriota bacterium]